MRQSDRVYEALRDDIVNWRLEPGTSLGEVELAERLGASRTPVREALQRLVRDRLVVSIPGRGSVVADISVGDVSQLYQMREALETYAARLAARLDDRSAFARLHEELGADRTALAASGGTRSVEHDELIERFDRAIDTAGGNSYIATALGDVRMHLARLRRIGRSDPSRLLRGADEHLAICAAIRDGDADRAAAATVEHIQNGLRHTLTALLGGLAGPLGPAPDTIEVTS